MATERGHPVAETPFWNPKGESVTPKVVLIVDDDSTVRRSLDLYLRFRGWQTVACASAEEGIEATRRRAFDVVISDYDLPGMDGVTFLEQVSRCGSDILRILMSGHRGLAEAFPESEVTKLLQKPLSEERLEASLRPLEGPMSQAASYDSNAGGRGRSVV